MVGCVIVLVGILWIVGCVCVFCVWWVLLVLGSMESGFVLLLVSFCWGCVLFGFFYVGCNVCIEVRGWWVGFVVVGSSG